MAPIPLRLDSKTPQLGAKMVAKLSSMQPRNIHLGAQIANLVPQAFSWIHLPHKGGWQQG
eukprot:6826545-Karenia_brevis.AAC.1